MFPSAWANQASTTTFLPRNGPRPSMDDKSTSGKEARNLRVGLVQMQIRTNRTEDNLARAEKYARQAAAEGCRLIVLPEAFSTGLNLPKSRQCATRIPE